VRCDGCKHLKLLVVRLSPLAVNCEFRLFAGDSVKSISENFFLDFYKVPTYFLYD